MEPHPISSSKTYNTSNQIMLTHCARQSCQGTDLHTYRIQTTDTGYLRCQYFWQYSIDVLKYINLPYITGQYLYNWFFFLIHMPVISRRFCEMDYIKRTSMVTWSSFITILKRYFHKRLWPSYITTHCMFGGWPLHSWSSRFPLWLRNDKLGCRLYDDVY